jgi:hypothetical protein
MPPVFDNSNLKDNLCGGCDCTGFTPSVGIVYDANAGTITATDNSTYAAGDARKIVNLRVTDKAGDKVDGNISEADGDDAVTIDVSSLDLSEGYRIDATVVTTAGCISDGHAGRVPGMLITAGNIGSWDKDSITIEIGEDDES